MRRRGGRSKMVTVAESFRSAFSSLVADVGELALLKSTLVTLIESELAEGTERRKNPPDERETA